METKENESLTAIGEYKFHGILPIAYEIFIQRIKYYATLHYKTLDQTDNLTDEMIDEFVSSMMFEQHFTQSDWLLCLEPCFVKGDKWTPENVIKRMDLLEHISTNENWFEFKKKFANKYRPGTIRSEYIKSGVALLSASLKNTTI